MIESRVIQYLSLALQAEVNIEIPANPPEELIVISKATSERENFISTATISFDCYAGSKYRAAELCTEVQDAMDKMTELDDISCCEFGGDFDNTDTDSKRYCYRVIYHITYL